MLERLLAKRLIVGDCWLWTGGTGRHGYGIARDSDGRERVVHRIVYELLVGPMPSGLQLRHVVCRTPACFNPAHVRPGTPTENEADKRIDGTVPFGDRNGTHTHPEKVARGERQGSARLTAADVLAIRASDLSQPALARRYGVTQACIWRVLHRQTWRHV